MWNTRAGQARHIEARARKEDDAGGHGRNIKVFRTRSGRRRRRRRTPAGRASEEQNPKAAG